MVSGRSAFSTGSVCRRGSVVLALGCTLIALGASAWAAAADNWAPAGPPDLTLPVSVL